MQNIYLVGFMGTGKTVVGKALSRRLNVEFLDLDELIEKKENRLIKDIFSQSGEPYFRKIEKEAVKCVSTRKDLIVACGGGVVLDSENTQILRDSGTIFCLAASVDTILVRIKKNDLRPLLNVENPREKIEGLLKERAPFYSRANYTIDTSNLSVEDVTTVILDYLKK